MRPRCSILTGGFDFSGCGDCTSCPPFEQTEMSNSEPSAIVLHGIPCMYGLYKFSWIIQVSIRMEKTVRSSLAAHLPPLVDYADLDGNLPISNAPSMACAWKKASSSP